MKRIVLCLHGSRQTAEIFQNQLSKLIDTLADVASFEFLDAPFLLPLLHPDDDVRTRSWCCPGLEASPESIALDGDTATGSNGDENHLNASYVDSDRLLDERMQRQPFPDILLGFSQGGLMVCRYLMRHSEEDSTLKAAIFIGTPDPRKVFARTDLLDQYIERQSAKANCDYNTEQPFLGDIRSLHIIGRKDKIVLPSESIAFAEACGPTAEVLVHEHSHSVPQLQVLFSSIRVLINGLNVNLEAEQAFTEERGKEIEMIAMMYGDECVCNRSRSLDAIVTLPLLDEGQLPDGPESCALAKLGLQFRVPPRYPVASPVLNIVGGPTTKDAMFERWCADMVARCTGYMLDDAALYGQILLPTRMFANEQAYASISFLKDVFATHFHNTDPGDDVDATQCAKEHMVSEWTSEDDASRSQYILETEEEARSLLDRRASAPNKFAQIDQTSVQSSRGGVLGGGGLAFQRSGGTWTPVIGLIGKPSAGKSTFFNAITDPQSESEAARVAAFPFTTIESNIGTGFGLIRCPCSVLLQGPKCIERRAQLSTNLTFGIEKCDARYGHACVRGSSDYRRHPILVKDVAGLVQGAYQGKGKGNQFLNDLCDACVLVHVVDGAGVTDAGGSSCTPGQGSTLDDITWIRKEVHNWIYDNLRAKWEVILRTPKKLRAMFTGYHASPSFVDDILQRIGITNDTMLQVQLKTWGPRELHLLVAVFIRLRFPIVVALNKVDLPTAKGLVEELHRRYSGENFVCMSAKIEWDLLTLRKKGLVEYVSGASDFVDRSAGVSGMSKEDAERLKSIRAFFQALKSKECHEEENISESGSNTTVPLSMSSTGVQDVIADAIERCTSVRVYPVSAFQPVIPSLKHCLLFIPGTTADDVFSAMIRNKIVDGKIVRFEALDILKDEKTPVILRKTDVLPNTTLLVRVLSNKRQLL
ncbi:unnamed protein product [Phytomonas sp. EM1]|nr:unnamed protein product [Phytomonas sp. EM1]|eukprot:CCW60330.1 unnamed protein product [Phytomonas sp. isolate EM1]